MTCACGCDAVIAENRRFLVAHNQRDRSIPRPRSTKSPQSPKFGGAPTDESLQWKENEPPPRQLLERFWSNVQKTDTCWLWMGAKMRTTRYGVFSVRIPSWRGGASRPEQTHRLSYEFAHGTIPTGGVIMHMCDVPICVNPAHLILGTHAANVADKVLKGRHRFGHTLSPLEIRAIRNEYGGLNRQEDIAKRYGISRALVSMIGRRIVWTDIA